MLGERGETTLKGVQLIFHYQKLYCASRVKVIFLIYKLLNLSLREAFNVVAKVAQLIV